MVRLQQTLGRVLVLAGALALTCWGYFLLHELWIQSVANRVLQQRISAAAKAEERQDAHSSVEVGTPHPGEIIGRLEIPRINISVIVLEGTESDILDVAAGHIPGTALPGTTGNIGIAAHRDTLFRALRQITSNDRLTFQTPSATFEYGVESTEVVDPSDIAVLHPTTDAELTLVTCYPFSYIGAAPKRFIVHARQRN